MINLSAINRGTALANPLLKGRGAIIATNPCGEEPLFPFESCNLGYINFVNFIRPPAQTYGSEDLKVRKRASGLAGFDFKRMAEVMRVAVRLMDNVFDASWFPVKECSDSVRNHRRIGIGGVGWAESLAMLDVPYDSEEAIKLAEKVAKTMYESAFDASCAIGKEKDPFPFVKYSIWAKKSKKPRNVALMTFPPSSGNAVIAGTSFGIEP